MGFSYVATDPVSKVSLYESPAQAGHAWAGYLLPPVAPPAAPPDRLSYADSLAQQRMGGYVFASARPAALGDAPGPFIAALAAYIDQQMSAPGLNLNALLWLLDADGPRFGPFKNYGCSYSHNPLTKVFATSSNVNFLLGQDLLFNVLSGVGLSVDAVSGSLRLSAPLATPPTLAFQRNASDIGVRVTGSGSMIRTFVPLEGPNAGCLTFTASINPAVTFGPGGLAVGFPLSARDTASGQLQRLFYPALSAPAALPASLAWVGTVDPLDPYNQKLSTAARLEGVLRCGLLPAGQPALPSTYRTALGHATALLPLGAASGQPPVIGLQSGALAFGCAAPAPAQPASSKALLTPAGRFGLSASGQAAGAQTNLLCGIFGSEQLSLATYDSGAPDNDSLLFVPASPAYAPVFPFQAATLDMPDSGNVATPLAPDYLGCWATVLQGGAGVPQYHAEPAGSPMFGLPPAARAAAALRAVAADTVLASTPPALPVPQGAAHAFPLLPYGGAVSGGPLAIDAALLSSFEASIVAATRKAVISGGAGATWRARAAAGRRVSALADSAARAEAPHYRTTPQGAVATVSSQDGDQDAFLSVTLGQTLDGGGQVLPFGFRFPDGTLQDALQTNQLFLVAVNAAHLSGGDARFDSTVGIAGWTMQAQVGAGVSPTSYRNVMLLKYCGGSVRERVSNPNAWSGAPEFSLAADAGAGVQGIAYTGLSQWLQDTIAAAEALAAEQPDSPYRHFLELVDDPAWTGVLVLQADLNPSSLPPGLQGIAAGLDLTRFVAHHFGFTASRVTVHGDGSITLDGNSSTFGLVDYQDPAFAAGQRNGLPPDTPIALPDTDNYAFRVLQLQVLFDNAVIKTFKSYVQLAVNRLLGSAVTGTTFGGSAMPNNGVVLDGSYIDQNGTGVYIFEQATPSIFSLDSNLLRSVAFQRIQFNCLGTVDAGATVLNRFSVWGTLDFASLEGDGALLDLLSFGALDPAQPPDGQGLAFSNLVIDMRYPQTTPAAVRFAEVTASLAYDLDASQARPDSLFKGFGLELSGFIAAADGQKPADFGFLPVSTTLKLATLDGPWHGVVYDVTMGGPGALVSAAGFHSTLLLAWSPASVAGSDEQAVFVGLSLPGAAPGAKLISLQGIFKLSIDSIGLMRHEGAHPGSYYYCLRLDNIAIKFLGIAKLPPDASICFFLFGDPKNTGSLGWYAAYVDDTAARQAPVPAALPLQAISTGSAA
jgi:hypothetical protein